MVAIARTHGLVRTVREKEVFSTVLLIGICAKASHTGEVRWIDFYLGVEQLRVALAEERSKKSAAIRGMETVDSIVLAMSGQYIGVGSQE
jgi:hypothetical protein